jgi:hypothetical protein
MILVAFLGLVLITYYSLALGNQDFHNTVQEHSNKIKDLKEKMISRL